MFIVLVYDIADSKRVQKTLKITRKYLTHIQNSVFEGEIVESKYKKLINELKIVMDNKKDSVISYIIRNKKLYERKDYGIFKPDSNNFIF